MLDDAKIDNELVAQVLADDKTAYAEIVDRYQYKLLRYVTYLIGNQTLAADVVQETFIKAYINLKGFKPGSKFSSWIYRIAHNEAMNAVKKTSRTRTESELDTTKELFYEESNIAEEIDRQILKKDVQNCMKQLETKYREVLYLYYFDRLKYSSISEVLHIPVSTAGIRLKRARTALKDICKRQGVKYE